MTTTPSNARIGRNDPCPCGSGKKHKRCCLQKETAFETLWSEYRHASDKLTHDMMQFATRKCGSHVDEAWQDFNMTDLPVALVDRSTEDQIFMPYFLFDWQPYRRAAGKSTRGKGGVVLRWYRLEKAGRLSEAECLLLDQASTQPLSFYEVLSIESGRRMAIRDLLIGGEHEVTERSASQILRRGEIIYAQIWHLPGHAILGRCAPLSIPPGRKAEIIPLRKKLQKRAIQRKQGLEASALLRYADEIRLTYLNIRDALHAPPRLCNTDGHPLVFHTLTYKVESPSAAFEALHPLALGRSKEDLLNDAELDASGELRSVEFDWLKKGNRKIASWDNTILGHIKVSGDQLVAEVNSERRAERLRKEIEKRLGDGAAYQSTISKTVEDALEKSRGQSARQERVADDADEILRDPEVRNRFREMVQKQLESWVRQKVPALGGRTPLEAVRDPDGREIVESLLIDWERHAEEGAYQPGIQPDFDAVRKLLKLPPSRL
jgi:hypothetical protein